MWLPVVVWAATFTYCIYLYFAVKDAPSAYCAESIMGIGYVIVIFINIIVFTLTLIMISVYPEKQNALLYRLLLLLTNFVTAAVLSNMIKINNPYL